MATVEILRDLDSLSLESLTDKCPLTPHLAFSNTQTSKILLYLFRILYVFFTPLCGFSWDFIKSKLTHTCKLLMIFLAMFADIILIAMWTISGNSNQEVLIVVDLFSIKFVHVYIKPVGIECRPLLVIHRVQSTGGCLS